MAPAVTVLISTYNDRRWVQKKLVEVERQTIFSQSEFLFIETASPGRERELLAPFCERHENCRLLAFEERSTLYEAWNLGWEQAHAPVMCYSNMDDCMHPCLLEQVVATFARRPWDVLSVLVAKQSETDPDRDSWAPQRLRRLPLSPRPGPFTAWRAAIAEKIGRFDGRFVAAGDKDFWSRILKARLGVGWVSKVLYLYTKGAAQLSKAHGSNAPREQDASLLREKPYPIRWPASYRWRARWASWALWLAPERICYPVPDAPTPGRPCEETDRAST